MGLLRSEDMELYDMTLPRDHAWEIMEKLGIIGRLHFVDLNKEEQVFNLTYEPIIKRCESTLRRISFIQEECKRNNIKMTPPDSPDHFFNTIDDMRLNIKKNDLLYFETIESEISQRELFLQEQIMKAKDMHENFNLLFEYRTVLRKTMKMLKGQQIDDNEDDKMDSERIENHDSTHKMGDGQIAVGHVAGTISQYEKQRFKKIVFRVTRGNAL